jgi:hypothetical protein
MKKSLCAGVLAACALLAGCGGNPAAPKATSSSTLTPSAAPPPLIEASALAGLLLKADQVDATMGASGMTATPYTRMGTGSSVPAECKSVATPALAPAYEGTGWTAYQGAIVQEPGDNREHFLDQNVVSFSTADRANSFYSQSVGRWQGCSNRNFTTHSSEPKNSDLTWAVGPVSDSGGMLTVTKSQVGSTTWRCQHALTVVSNVVVDVSACAHSDANTFAVAVAKQIVANASPVGGAAHPGK